MKMGRSDAFASTIGTTFHAKHWLSLDPCGLVCISISFSAHIFALCVIPTHLISHSLPGMIVFGTVYVPAAALALWSLFMAWTTNPGAVPMGARPLDEDEDEEENKEGNKIVAAVDVSLSDGVGVGNRTALNEEEDEEREKLVAQVQLSTPSKSSTTTTTPSSSLALQSTVDTAAATTTTTSNRRKQMKRGIRRCRKCNDNYKPPRAHHDSVTGRCIVKMDHYCPWVCNAVGALNHKFFFLFILYTFIASVTSLLLILIRFVRCGFLSGDDSIHPSQHHHHHYGGNNSSSDNGNSTGLTIIPNDKNGSVEEEEGGTVNGGGGDDDDDPLSLRYLLVQSVVLMLDTVASSQQEEEEGGEDSVANQNWYTGKLDHQDKDYHFEYLGCTNLFTNEVLFLAVITVLFLFFTCCMLLEQIDAIESNTSKIARMKLSSGLGGKELRRVTTDVNEMFGGTSATTSWHWFVPLPVWFPTDSMRDDILGYKWDLTCGDEPYREDDEEMGKRKMVSSMIIREEIGLGSVDLGIYESKEEEDDDDEEEEDFVPTTPFIGNESRLLSAKEGNTTTRGTDTSLTSPGTTVSSLSRGDHHVVHSVESSSKKKTAESKVKKRMPRISNDGDLNLGSLGTMNRLS